MKYIAVINPETITPTDGELFTLEKTNGIEVYNHALEYETEGKTILSLGAWGSSCGIINCNYEEDELCIISSGSAKLTNQDGESMIFSAGQGFIIKSGFKGTWEFIGNVRKWYVIYR